MQQCDAEVDQLHRSVWLDQDVLGLQVAVDHAVLVAILQRIAQLNGDPNRLLDRQRRVLAKVFTQQCPVDIFQDQVGRRATVEAALLDQFLDVGVVQTLADLQLALVPTERPGIADQTRKRDLEHDESASGAVARLVGVVHAPLAETLEDLVFVVYRLTGFVAHAAQASRGHA